MLIPLLLVSGIVLFGVGIFFIVKGILDTPGRPPSPEALASEKIKLQMQETAALELKLKTQLDDSKAACEVLKSENQRLQDLAGSMTHQQEAFEQEKQALNQEKEKSLAWVGQMTSENASLQNQIQEKIKELEGLQGRLANFEKEKGEALSAAEKTQEALKAETQKLQDQLASAADQLGSQKQDTQELENLKSEKEALAKMKAELEENFRKIKEENSIALKKEEMLQYELTKSRAQAFGLEKFCEDFKVEIEAHIQEIDQLKSENESFRRLYEETQHNLEVLKESTTELIKKEQLSKEELERSRAQLMDLEKVYSDFRSKFESLEAVNKDSQEKKDGSHTP